MHKVIIKLVGGIWGLRKKYYSSSGYYKKMLMKLNDIYFSKYGSWIGIDTKFDSVPIFPHGVLGVFISGQARIGKNCVIFQQVTIGSNTLPDSKRKGAPTIGDNCFIGSGAKIIGNINIGDNVRIGANCVVVTDVPDNSVVVSQSSRIIKKDKINNKHYSKNSNGEWVYMKDGVWVIESDKEVVKSLSFN